MLKILLLSVAIIAASTQYDNAWVLTLKRTPSCVKIAPHSEANQQQLLIGHTDGEVELIDAHNGTLLVSARLFKDKIEQIVIDNSLKLSFIRSGHSLAVIDSNLNILEMLSF